MSKIEPLMTEKELAVKYGIPKYLRQYAKRYGKLDVMSIVQKHRQAKLRTHK